MGIVVKGRVTSEGHTCLAIPPSAGDWQIGGGDEGREDKSLYLLTTTSLSWLHGVSLLTVGYACLSLRAFTCYPVLGTTVQGCGLCHGWRATVWLDWQTIPWYPIHSASSQAPPPPPAARPPPVIPRHASRCHHCIRTHHQHVTRCPRAWPPLKRLGNSGSPPYYSPGPSSRPTCPCRARRSAAARVPRGAPHRPRGGAPPPSLDGSG